jgi:hypothetical protein
MPHRGIYRFFKCKLLVSRKRKKSLFSTESSTIQYIKIYLKKSVQRQPREPFPAASPWLQEIAALPLSGAAPFAHPLTARQQIPVRDLAACRMLSQNR